jgi:hypothetical protein
MNLEGVGDLQKKQTARSHKDCEPSGGLVGIDQEVVTLTWPLRQLRVHLAMLLTDLRQAESILKSPVVCGL